jgi:hypothetical protein
VVSASGDQTLKVWDLASGRVETTLEGHADWVTGCAVTPDGQMVVSASEDKTLKVWNLASGRVEATLEGHAGRVTACAVTPDGRSAVSASFDQTLKVWDLQTGACILTHRANATCSAIATTATTIIVGDAAGAIWFLDWPKPSVPDEPMFDVFFSHNSHDKPAVRQLKAMVVKHGLAVWLDEDQLQPGIPWQPQLERGIKSSRSVAVLIGKDGVGPWANEEMQAALRLAVQDRRPVIPVLLPGSTKEPELPLFLENRTWVDLRDEWTEEGMANLVWGITGRKP